MEPDNQDNRKRVEAADLRVGQVWHRGESFRVIQRIEDGSVVFDATYGPGYGDTPCRRRHDLATFLGSINHPAYGFSLVYSPAKNGGVA